MSTTPPERPPLTQRNDIIAYNDRLKNHARTSGYFGDSPEAASKREEYLKKYYEAVFNGNTDNIDMFELDAVKLNMSPQVAQKIYAEAVAAFQKNSQANSKIYRIYNGQNVENTVLVDLRNYKNFRSSADSLNYVFNQRTISSQS